MVSLGSLLLPILVSAVLVFIVSAIIHMVLKYHNKDYTALPNEEAVRDTIRTFVDHGVEFTIATDGPEMMRTHLRDELDLLRRIGALDEEQLAQANQRGHDSSFVHGTPVRPRV